MRTYSIEQIGRMGVLTNVNGASMVLGCTPQYTRRLCKEGKLKAIRMGNRWRIKTSSVLELVGLKPRSDEPSVAHEGNPTGPQCRNVKVVPQCKNAIVEPTCENNDAEPQCGNLIVDNSYWDKIIAENRKTPAKKRRGYK